jgi:hypothetical protein
VASGSVEVIDDGAVVVVAALVVVGLVGIGVEGVTGSSSPGIRIDVPFPGTLDVELVTVVVDRLPPIPPLVLVPEVVEAGGSVKLVKDVLNELVAVGTVPPLAPLVT